ncbi:serine hydrolase domain-containing protein [Streptomyces sp. SDr-06]|uniref:serine hydrolase domain-containing protein n=1 Tax=Streptomyces sp. SDr-06 TaxID=2267702 RepID=UPI000DEB08CB|nr:serine hydrolase domain-containing protein [Streptomyces sp. SDr-06]RCH66728.1 class A beta-lactamase-related serine hydrolase [Streptomyces sp. SDr-06]
MSHRKAVAASALLAAALLVPAATPAMAAAPDAGADRAALQQALDATVAAGVPGAVAEVRDGRGVWRGSSGTADLASGRAAHAGDRFRAGSVTKTFVATVVLQLVADGRVKLDDDIERQLPGVVPNGAHITVRQLLNHTSGLANYTDVLLGKHDPVRDAQKATYTPRQLIALVADIPNRPAPGTTWEYSNTNYVVLGLLVEHITGQSLAHEIDHRIVRPLHLKATSFPTSPSVPGQHLHGYEWLEGRGTGAAPTDLTEFSPAAYWAAGTLISTTHDLNTFYKALLDGRLLPDRMMKEMRTLHPMDAKRPNRSYGLGLESNGTTCPSEKPVVGHTGEVVGYQTFSFTSADGKRQITLSVNTGLTMTDAEGTAATKMLSTALCRTA